MGGLKVKRREENRDLQLKGKRRKRRGVWWGCNYIINNMLKKGKQSRSEKMIPSPAHDEISSIGPLNTQKSQHSIDGVQLEEVKQLRLALSPPGCLEADGSLNYRYFAEQVNEAWNKKKDTALLMQGLEKHGVGKWAAIKSDFLNDKPIITLILQTKLLLGSRDLQDYNNRKLSTDEIAQIKEDNMKRAEAEGLLYNTMRYSSLAQIHAAKQYCMLPQFDQFVGTKTKETQRKRDRVKAKKSRAKLEKGCHTLENFFKKQGDFHNQQVELKQLPEIEKKKRVEEQEKSSPETLSLTKTNSEENQCLVQQE